MAVLMVATVFPVNAFAVDANTPVSLNGTTFKQGDAVNAELYSLACDASFTVGNEWVYITVAGLSENMEAALAIIEDKIANVKGDDAILANCKADEFRGRINSKTNQRACYSMLANYINYGKDNPATHVLSNKEIQTLSSDELLAQIKNALNYEQKVTYYGPMEMDQVIEVIGKYRICCYVSCFLISINFYRFKNKTFRFIYACRNNIFII